MDFDLDDVLIWTFRMVVIILIKNICVAIIFAFPVPLFLKQFFYLFLARSRVLRRMATGAYFEAMFLWTALFCTINDVSYYIAM